MQLHVRLLPRGKDEILQMKEDADGLHLLDTLRLSPEAHLILRNETPLPIDEKLSDGDKLSIIAVVSGG